MIESSALVNTLSPPISKFPVSCFRVIVLASEVSLKTIICPSAGVPPPTILIFTKSSVVPDSGIIA